VGLQHLHGGGLVGADAAGQLGGGAGCKVGHWGRASIGQMVDRPLLREGPEARFRPVDYSDSSEHRLCCGVSHVQGGGRLLLPEENITFVAPNSIWGPSDDRGGLPVHSDGSHTSEALGATARAEWNEVLLLAARVVTGLRCDRRERVLLGGEGRRSYPCGADTINQVWDDKGAPLWHLGRDPHTVDI
jgi:hypothetical protein